MPVIFEQQHGLWVYYLSKYRIVYRLERKQKVAIGLEEAWDFFSSPKNLATITPDDMGFDIVDELPEKMYEGMLIRYKVSPLLGIKLNWSSEISQIKEHEFFIDQQLEGPYQTWHHQHFFKPIKGGVEMRDIVHYNLPLGFIGRLFHPILVKKKLNDIFDYRFKKVEKLFGSLD